MITAAQFRADFPEFSSTVTFPNMQVDFWITLAYKLLNADRWGDIIDQGAELFIAHNLALWAFSRAGGANNGIPGMSSGVISSASVDKISVSYDTGNSMEADAGHWNQTNYGKQYIHLARMIGSGPIQIGQGVSPNFNASAWAGIIPPGF